jgi:GNAT superfamily N-acetyltransferase
MDYERRYLGRYVECHRSLVVLVTDANGHALGATTCMPLADEQSEFQAPFESRGDDVEKILYLGESVVAREYRGMGLGKQFFHLREQHARHLGLQASAFCAVDRPEDDPRRPEAYRSPEALWKSQGYQKQMDLKATFSWKEIGESEDHPKSLTFWMKSLLP